MTEKPTDDFAFLADNYKVFLFDSPQKPVNYLRLGFGQRSKYCLADFFLPKGTPPPFDGKLVSLKIWRNLGVGYGRARLTSSQLEQKQCV